MVKVKRIRSTSSRIVLEIEKPRGPKKFKRSVKEKKLESFSQECIALVKALKTENNALKNQIKRLETQSQANEASIRKIRNVCDETKLKIAKSAFRRMREGLVKSPDRMHRATKEALVAVGRWQEFKLEFAQRYR
jgi:molecular chaperone GrpE (heat shock protein)